MTGYHRIRNDDSIAADLIGLGIAVLLFVFLLVFCVGPERKKCEARGGVYLPRERACVRGPDPQ